MVKNLPAMQETWVRSLGWDDPLEKEMAIHSSILAWRIPWTENSMQGYNPWGCKEQDTTERLSVNGKDRCLSAGFYRFFFLMQMSKCVDTQGTVWKRPNILTWEKAFQ